MKSLWSLIFVFALVACGSSGDGSGEQPLATGNASGAGGGSQSGSCGSMGTEACEAFRLVNQERTSRGVAALQVSSSCVAAAQYHASDMYMNDYFAHDGLNETWSQRLRRFGVTGAIAENIAISSSAERVVSQWMNSTGHRNNILNSSYRYAGMGYHSGYWVQCFSANP